MTSINDCYKNFIKEILEKGTERYKDNDEKIIEKIGNYYYIDNPFGLNFVEEQKKYTSKNLLEDIDSGKFDINFSPIKSESLKKYILSLENPYDISFVYTYPNRLISYFDINQLQTIINRISKNFGTNRAIAITYDPKNDSNKKDIPCLQIIQIIVNKTGELDIHCFFRSNDIYGAFYSNMYFIGFLGLKIAEELNKKILNMHFSLKGIYYYCSSAHIYSYDKKNASKVIK